MRSDARLVAAPLLASLDRRPSARRCPVRRVRGAQAPQLVDRVVAVVDEDPILASELERVIASASRAPEGEERRALRRRVLDGLIEQRLRFHEIDRFGFEQVPVDEIERSVAEIRAPLRRARRSSARGSRDLGLDRGGLRQLVARQLMVLTYVEERLGPRVFVGLDDIRAYFDEVLTPELQRAASRCRRSRRCASRSAPCSRSSASTRRSSAGPRSCGARPTSSSTSTSQRPSPAAGA